LRNDTSAVRGAAIPVVAPVCSIDDGCAEPGANSARALDAKIEKAAAMVSCFDMVRCT
jgi:hypothetical protein